MYVISNMYKHSLKFKVVSILIIFCNMVRNKRKVAFFKSI